MSPLTPLFISLGIGLVIMISVGILVYIKKKRNPKGAVFSAPVVVTTTTQHAPTGRYPVSVEHTPSGGYQATPYPPGVVAQPYPLNPGAMPMPATHPAPYPNVGFQTDVVHGYPPTTASASSNPPSYDQVVTSDSYVKQAPYNPNYTGAPTH